MQICKSLEDLKVRIAAITQRNESVGFIPTMGALHKGHLSLFQRSKSENSITVGSIFVNPIQFNNPSDLDKYPRTEDKDITSLQNVGCDILFMPPASEMYPQKPQVHISFGPLAEKLEGKFRPGHFSGVGVVVSKLFHLVQPDVAYFGQKDLQQFLIIQKMVDDLSFPVRLVCCETSRETDGLAMSSRNLRIPDAMRNHAPAIYKSLHMAKEMIFTHPISHIKNAVLRFYFPNTDLKLEYFEVVDGKTLEEVTDVDRHSTIAICVAATLGEIRLIDNLVFTVD